MGYTHYWQRPRTIAAATFRAIRADFDRLVLPLTDAGVELAGGLGEGPPEITGEVIWFNGLTECGHPQNEEISIPYPPEDAEGVGPSVTAMDEHSDGPIMGVRHRCCNGQCSYETFRFPRVLDLEMHREPDDAGLYTDFVKTGFRPYDIAVTAALLIAKKHLKDRLVIHSNGADPQWSDARRICQRVLGYGDWFGIVEKRIVEKWPGEGEREVQVRTLEEVNEPLQYRDNR